MSAVVFVVHRRRIDFAAYRLERRLMAQYDVTIKRCFRIPAGLYANETHA